MPPLSLLPRDWARPSVDCADSPATAGPRASISAARAAVLRLSADAVLRLTLISGDLIAERDKPSVGQGAALEGLGDLIQPNQRDH